MSWTLAILERDEVGYLVTSIPAQEVSDAYPTNLDGTDPGPLRATFLCARLEHVQVLPAGTILAPGKRTVAPACERWVWRMNNASAATIGSSAVQVASMSAQWPPLLFSGRSGRVGEVETASGSITRVPPTSARADE